MSHPHPRRRRRYVRDPRLLLGGAGRLDLL